MGKTAKSRRKSQGRDVAQIVFGFVFMLVGLGILISAIHQRVIRPRAWGWVETPCVIEKLELRVHAAEQRPFSLDVVFHYSWNGQSHESTRCLAGGQPFAHSSYTDLMEILRSKTKAPVCYVNPRNPSTAALFVSDSETRGDWGVFLAFGLGFSVIGAGIIRHGFKPGSDGLVLCGAFGFFFLVGVILTFNLSIMPIFQHIRTRSWKEVEARVLWSEVRTDGRGRRRSVRPDVFYEFQWAGNTFRSNNINCWRLISGDASAQDTVRNNSEGKLVKCFVNPENPGEAVLDREPGLRFLLALFPLPFLVVGLLGLHWGWARLRGEVRVISHRRAAQPGRDVRWNHR